MSGAVWKLKRLRAMGLPEIVYRVRQVLNAKAEARGWGLAARPAEHAGPCGRAWTDRLPKGFGVEQYRPAAERVLAGHFDVFALRAADMGFPPDWNRDPKTGTRAPLEFGKTLNYRDERIVGDIKYLWEPNRHLELVTLAQAFHLTGEARFAEGARVLLDSWFEQCPYPLGPNWTSSLEHAVRLVNWAVAWHLLGGEGSALFAGVEGDAFRRRWLDSIYQHCHFISGHFSLYSSANNHLLGEYMGLFIGSVMWPGWQESAGWRDLAKTGFENEVLKQNAVDGTNREQAIWYQHEVADMMLLCGVFGRANGIEFASGYWKRLEAMLEFIAAVMDVGGNVPMLGDSDDAVMVRFSRHPDFNVYRSLLATGALLFRRPDFKVKAGRFDDKSRWLLGDDAEARFDALPKEDGFPVRRAFPEGGYSVLGDRLGEPDEVRLVADAGPLGYLSIAAHGHADALSFTLSLGGREMLVDPGTYAYHTLKKWRDYFRGTAAHNTVRVDGVDQSVAGGNFLWLKHARAVCEHFESTPEQDVWVAQHDGYLRLPDAVTHRRTIRFDKRSGQIRIVDRLECRLTHRIEVFWHAAEACQVEVENGVVAFHNDGVAFSMTMEGGAWHPQLISGQEDPPLGWVSRRFDEKMPCTTVVWRGEIKGTTELVTSILISNEFRSGEQKK